VDVAHPHRLLQIRESADDRVEDPVVSAMPGPDRLTGLFGVAAMSAAAGARVTHPITRAAFQQCFQGPRSVGMLSS
jgi:hypothetical protein